MLRMLRRGKKRTVTDQIWFLGQDFQRKPKDFEKNIPVCRSLSSGSVRRNPAPDGIQMLSFWVYFS